MATAEHDYSENPVQITERIVVLTELVVNGPIVSISELQQRALRASQLGRVNGFNFRPQDILGVNIAIAALSPYIISENGEGAIKLQPHAYEDVRTYLDNQLSLAGQREVSLLTTPLPSPSPKAVSLLDGDYFPRPFEEGQ